MATTFDWDASQILGVFHEKYNQMRCVSHAPSKGRRCTQPIAAKNRVAASDRLEILGTKDPRSSSSRALLKEIARLTLCRGNHIHQVDIMVERWKLILSQLDRGSFMVVPLPANDLTRLSAGRPIYAVAIGAERVSHMARPVPQTIRTGILIPQAPRIATEHITGDRFSPVTPVALTRTSDDIDVRRRSSHAIQSTSSVIGRVTPPTLRTEDEFLHSSALQVHGLPTPPPLEMTATPATTTSVTTTSTSSSTTTTTTITTTTVTTTTDTPLLSRPSNAQSRSTRPPTSRPENLGGHVTPTRLTAPINSSSPSQAMTAISHRSSAPFPGIRSVTSPSQSPRTIPQPHISTSSQHDPLQSSRTARAQVQSDFTSASSPALPAQASRVNLTLQSSSSSSSQSSLSPPDSPRIASPSPQQLSPNQPHPSPSPPPQQRLPTCSSHHVLRRPLPSECAICLDVLTVAPHPWCKGQCGMNFHSACWNTWAETCQDQRRRLTCPHCRATWMGRCEHDEQDDAVVESENEIP